MSHVCKSNSTFSVHTKSVDDLTENEISILGLENASTVSDI